MNKFSTYIRPANKRHFLLGLGVLLLLIQWPTTFLQAQSSSIPSMMAYQAEARTNSGALIINEEIGVRFAFTSRDGSSRVFYEEEHRVKTDNNGQFTVFIGNGTTNSKTTLGQIPWGEVPVYLGVFLNTSETEGYQLANRSQMMGVPYAITAQRAGAFADSSAVEVRNQSRHWLTAGNDASEPETHFVGTRDNEDLYIKTANTTRAIFTKEGQLQIYSGVGGDDGQDTQPDDYPVTIEDGDQGIYIKVNGSRTAANNFMTFADGNDQVWGRIEGQTWEEIQASESYKIQVALYSLKGASLGLQIVGELAGAVAYAISIYGAGVAPPTVANLIILGTEVATLIADAVTWSNNLQQNQGVSFATGQGDYAEFLLRDSTSRDIYPAEVIGVKNGKVSLQTEGADQYFIVSSSPAVLGNAPQPEEEHLYEKVAFMGQVIAKVAGAVKVGDYILPSGNNDGLAIAVAPNAMKIGDYKRIIGVAWQDAPEALVNYVNVAVGIHANDLGKELDALNRKVQKIYEVLEGKEAITGLSELKSTEMTANPIYQTIKSKSLDDEYVIQVLEENRTILEGVFVKVREQVESMGYEVDQIPELQAMFDDPVQMLKDLRQNPQFDSYWSTIDTQIQELENSKE